MRSRTLEPRSPWYRPREASPPLDPKSDDPGAQTPATLRFAKDPQSQALLAHTGRLDSVQEKDFDAVFFPGGHGPLWDLAEDAKAIALIEAFYRVGKPVAAVCHAPGVFRHTRKADGSPLVQGHKVTGFTNAEEAAVGLTEVVPFLVEDMLKANGGDYHKGPDWAPHVVVDGHLITGQNPASSEGVALALLKTR